MLQFRNVSTITSATGNRTINKPAGVLEGDHMFCHVALSGNFAPTMPDGWNLVAGAEITGTNNIRIYKKVAGASEPASYDITVPGGSASTIGIVAWYSDLGRAILIDGVNTSTNSSSTNRTWAAVVTTIANAILQCFGTLNTNTGTTPIVDERWDTGSAPRIYLMTETVAAIGDTGTRVATGALASASKCVTLAIAEEPLADLVAPTSLAATPVLSDQIDLTWLDSNADEDEFEIERSPDDADWTLLDTTTATSYTDTGLTPETTYYYRVRAVRGAEESDYSVSDFAVTYAELTAPADFEVTSIGSREITLAWTTDDDAVAGFTVEQSTDDVDYTEIAQTANLFYTVTGLDPEQTYYFKVRAFREP